jgi:cold shock protein
MKTGTVKWFDADMGYGFIAPDDGGPEVFVHIRAVERAGMFDLQQGQKLTFEVVIEKGSGKSAAYDLNDG